MCEGSRKRLSLDESIGIEVAPSLAGGQMNTQLMWVIVIAVAALAIVAFLLARRSQTEHLRHRFGPEYDRVVHEVGAVGKAEATLRAKEARVERLRIRPLSQADI